MTQNEKEFVIFISLLCALIIFLILITNTFAQSAGFGDICDNVTGSPYVNYNPDLISNPIYATGGDYDGEPNGCSWLLLPFSETDYRTPQIPISGINTDYVQYSFVAQAPITDSVVTVQLNYVDNTGTNHPVVFDIPLVSSAGWQSFNINFDGFGEQIGGANSFVSMQFGVSDNQSDVWIDKIRMLAFEPGTATPTSTAVISPTATDSPTCEYQSNAPSSPSPVMWLNAETLALSYNHGDLIDSWSDDSGNGNSISQSDDALKATYVVNGDLPSALFASDRYAMPLSLVNDTSFTLLYVSNGTNHLYIESIQNSNNGVFGALPPNVAVIFQDLDANPDHQFNPTGETRSPLIINMSRSGNTGFARYIETTELQTTTYDLTNFDPTAFDTNWLGVREQLNGFTSPFAGYVHEFIVFSSYQSDEDLSDWYQYLSRWQCQDFIDPTPTATTTITPTTTSTPTDFPFPTSTRTPLPAPLSTSTLTPIAIATQTPNPTGTSISFPPIPAPGTPFPIPTPIVGGSCNQQISGNYDFCFNYGFVELNCWIVIPTISIISFPGFQICFELYGVVLKIFGFVVPTYLIVVAIAFLIIWRWIL